MPERQAVSTDLTFITVRNQVKRADVKPFGINIGFHNRYGASQILKNLIINPGFEAGEFASIIIVGDGGSAQRFTSDNWKTEWNDDRLGIGQPVGFWEGAAYEVVFGRSKGRRGKIARFRHEANRYTFYTADSGSRFEVGDVVYLRHEAPSSSAGMTHAEYDSSQLRPGSVGRQSLRLRRPPNLWEWSFVYTMDSLWRDQDKEAGKLLIADGEWELSFWMRAATEDTDLKIEFGRDGEFTFHRETMVVSRNWRKVTRIISVPRGGDRYHDPKGGAAARTLALKFRVDKGGEAVWVDDMSLQRVGQLNPTVFSDKFVDKLRELNPGVLRNWGHQLGSTLNNQLQPPFTRRMTGHNPRQRIANHFHFSLHEFLELAQELGADPWYVIPPTFTEGEMQDLVAYLAAPPNKHVMGARRAMLGQTQPWTEVFDKIHLEYGNEMWGANQGTDPFIGATLRGGERLGSVAGERFVALKRSAFYGDSAEKLNLIIGGQTNEFRRQTEIETYSDSHDTVALSPYFGHLDILDETRMFTALYARSFQDVWSRNHGLVRANQKEIEAVKPDTDLAIYEINFHTTTDRHIPDFIRYNFVTSIAGGIALPLYMLLYLRDAGIRHQCAFTALQFSYAMNGPGLNGKHVRLWGMLRDLEATGRARPTWLALQMVNRAMRGNLLQTMQRGVNPFWRQTQINHIRESLSINYVQSFVFHDDNDYSVILFNLHPLKSQKVQIELPGLPMSTATLKQLVANSAESNNEDAENVRIETETITDLTPQYEIHLPPHSISVLETRNFRIFLPTVINR